MRHKKWVIVALVVALVAAGAYILLREKTPIWTEDDTAVKFLEGKEVSPGFVTVNQRPPFYRGQMPLKYRSVDSLGDGRGRIISFTFDDFSTFFIYDESIPGITGARTRDSQGRLVAEARLDYRDGKVYMEEFHYGADSQLIFKCTSKINPVTGFKVSETQTRGTKRREYYFKWPILIPASW